MEANSCRLYFGLLLIETCHTEFGLIAIQMDLQGKRDKLKIWVPFIIYNRKISSMSAHIRSVSQEVMVWASSKVKTNVY